MIKTGIDLVNNKRLEKNFSDEKFLEKVYHVSELRDKSKLISIFALKEATMKALGKKVDWKEIEIKYIDSRPEIRLSEDIKPESFVSIDGSVSHDGEYTVAFVAIELNRNN